MIGDFLFSCAMDSATLAVSSSVIVRCSSLKSFSSRRIQAELCFERRKFSKIFAVYPNGSASRVGTFEIGYGNSLFFFFFFFREIT